MVLIWYAGLEMERAVCSKLLPGHHLKHRVFVSASETNGMNSDFNTVSDVGMGAIHFCNSLLRHRNTQMLTSSDGKKKHG